jgi:hypothetical protein
MNTALFVLANLAVGYIIIWSVQNDRRKANDTEGVFAIRRVKAATAQQGSSKGRAASMPLRRRT